MGDCLGERSITIGDHVTGITSAYSACERQRLWSCLASATSGWPLAWAVAEIGLPGGAVAPASSSGMLAVSALTGALVILLFRPHADVGQRWFLWITSCGLVMEVTWHAIPGISQGGGDLPPGARGLLIPLIGTVTYEGIPLLAAATRVIKTEERRAPLDAVTYGGLSIMALGAVTPASTQLFGALIWVGVGLALTAGLSRVAFGGLPDRLGAAPVSPPRTHIAGATWSLCLLTALVMARGAGEFTFTSSTDISPARAFQLATTSLSALTCLGAAIAALRCARGARQALRAVVAEPGEIRLELREWGSGTPFALCLDEPLIASVRVGQEVTIPARSIRTERDGPFRVGTPVWAAKRVWPMPRGELAAALASRGYGWLARSGGAATMCAFTAFF